MAERFAELPSGVRLCFETFGDPRDPAVLLVMGLGTQMIAWHEDFCSMLVDRGFHVIRFDNRDCGRSSAMHGRPPTPAQLLTRRVNATYKLRDMAADAIGLLDELEIPAAHVVGASMGGMIAQVLAIGYPDRVLSLTSIMSTTGNWRLGRPALAVYPVLLRPAPQDREAYIEHLGRLLSKIGSPDFPRDEAELRGLDVPALVIHGTKDRLVNRSGGRATARVIPGAELLEIEGMGHDMPRGTWPEIVEGIARVTSRARSEPSRAAV